MYTKKQIEMVTANLGVFVEFKDMSLYEYLKAVMDCIEKQEKLELNKEK